MSLAPKDSVLLYLLCIFHACQWQASLSDVEEKVMGQRPRRPTCCYIRQQRMTMQEYSLCANVVWYVTTQTRQYKAYDTEVLEG